MWGKSLQAIAEALQQMRGGYFVLRGDDGEQYVVLRKSEFDELTGAPSAEVQLPLPANPASSPLEEQRNLDHILGRINREIALYQAGQEEDRVVLENGVDETDLEREEGLLRRVRFEPLRGDLPPELQE